MYSYGMKVLLSFTGVNMSEITCSEHATSDLKALLAPRELAVATLRLQGTPVDEVACMLNIKPSSVRTTMHRVYQKCGVANYDDFCSTYAEPAESGFRTSDSALGDRSISTCSFLQLVFELLFLMCAPVALIYILFLHASPVRFHLNDMLAIGFMALGSLFAFTCAPALKRWVVAQSPWKRLLLSSGFAIGPIACFSDLLFSWMLLKRFVPFQGAAHFAAYALCLVIPSFVLSVVRTSSLLLFEALLRHPIVLCLLFAVQVVIAFASYLEGAIATMACTTVILASVYLFGFSEQRPGCNNNCFMKMLEVQSGSGRPALMGSFVTASSVLGMTLGFALLPSTHGLVVLAACLPSLSILFSIGYVSYRIGILSIPQLAAQSVLILCVMGVVATVAHSCLLGSLAGASLALLRVMRPSTSDSAHHGFVKYGAYAFAPCICTGVFLGVLFIRVSSSSLFGALDLYATVALEFFSVCLTLVLVLSCVRAIWRLCQCSIDLAAPKPFAGMACPDDMQRIRAFLVLRGMSDFECEVALRSVQGTSIHQIACELQYSASSVRAARGHLYRTLGVHDIAGLRAALSQVIIV